MRHVETLVIGGGAMGSATTWALAKRGRPVMLVEQFERGHVHGASHGEYRNFNVGYYQRHYVDMLVESRRLWDELAEASGTQILELVGLANHGANPHLAETFEAITAAGIRAELLAPEEAGKRWPGMIFDGTVLFSPDAGRVRADGSIVAMQEESARLGADIRHSTRVVSMKILGETAVRVEIEQDGVVETWQASTVVATVGAWTAKLLGDSVALPRLSVAQVQPVHFAALDDSSPWPSFNHSRGTDTTRNDYWYKDVYGMLTPGVGIKVGWHGGGIPVDPDHRTAKVDAAELAALRRYAAEWLPGVDPASFEQISCTYTSTDTEDFVLDRVGPLVIGAGFSGHGFKFTPAIGSALAGLVVGESSAAGIFGIDYRRP